MTSFSSRKDPLKLRMLFPDILILVDSDLILMSISLAAIEAEALLLSSNGASSSA